MGLLKDVIGVVSDNNTNITYASVKSKNNKLGIIELGIELDNIDTLRKVMTSLQSLPDVYSVKRIQTSYGQSSGQSNRKNQKKQGRKKTSH